MPAPPGQVRIISGQWRRSVVPVLDRPGLRPTPDRVRETVFNWLQTRLPKEWAECRVADVFAGTGVLGLEAASRGAAEVVFFERDAAVAEAIRGTLVRLKAPPTHRVAMGDAMAGLRALPAASQDLLFLDPPYASGLLEPALEAAHRALHPEGLVYVERRERIDAAWAGGLGYTLVVEGRMGAVSHALLGLSLPA